MTRKASPVYPCAPVNVLVEGMYRERSPMSPDYLTWDFGRDAGADLEKAEQ